jgi:hypothetical protein
VDAAKPDLFLCHNAADKPWVKELGARLEAESIDGMEHGRRIRVFLDEWDIEKGENIVSRLGDELASGAFVAVVMSPEFFASDWTRFEWTDVVARDPANKGGQLLPVRRRDSSHDGKQRLKLPPPFNALNYFDFRSDARFEAEFEALLRRIRGQPPSRGRTVLPRYSSGTSHSPKPPSGIEVAEPLDEILVSNLAPLTDTPPALYIATTTLKNVSEIPADAGLEAITVRIFGERLITFADMEDPECALNAFIDPYSIKRYEFSQCLQDQDRLAYWLALANKSLERALRKRGVAQDDKRRFYFSPAPGGTDRLITIGTQRPREVAAKKRHHITGDEFWVHYCANIRFRVFGPNPFLRILPSYSFTHDGVQSLDSKQAGRFRVIWGGKQDSAAVLRQVLFWLLFMSDGHEEWDLETGGSPIRMSVMPATAATKVGIATDHVSIKALVEPANDELGRVADSANVEQATADEESEDEDDLDDGEESS